MNQVEYQVMQLSNEYINIITPSLAHQYRIVVKIFDDKEVIFLSDIQLEESKNRELMLLLNRVVNVEIVSTDTIDEYLSKYYQRVDKEHGKAHFDQERSIESLIGEAIVLRSSDIHIENLVDSSRIRFRIDGQLLERYFISKKECLLLINQVKIRAKLDIAERRLPQDGRANIVLKEGGAASIRVSIIPSISGEKAVLRILNRSSSNISLRTLGLTDEYRNELTQATSKKQGLIMVSGPTGSGKTTTLMALIKELNISQSNILTIEDPVEYRIEGVTQVNVNRSIQLDFASALRSFLRQDPDIIMVGEIRDQETAEICIRAAMTGHLVLSTLHTNSAIGIIDRLKDLGIPEYMLSDTISLLVGQRLVRVLCDKCKQINDTGSYYLPIGCKACYHTGYMGRTAIYEIIPSSGDLRSAIKKGEYKDEWYLGLSLQAKQLLKTGVTSYDEIKSFIL